jgi:metal-responsive CopG/Arc/MetJ family transcriptional regulator
MLGAEKMKSLRYQMYYSKLLLEKIDKVKKEKGFNYRSQAIIYLINLGLDQLKINK